MGGVKGAELEFELFSEKIYFREKEDRWKRKIIYTPVIEAWGSW